jgi:phosphate transport system substrate-binding protein
MAGFAVAQAGPALADPTTQENAAGSDTTQDVMNQYSVDLAGNLLGSWNAVDPVSGLLTTNIEFIKGINATQPALTCLSQRPNGSTQGVIGLRESINPATTAAPALAPVMPPNCQDIARSSSGPTVTSTGALQYIPFAEDAVTGAVGPATAGTIQGITGSVNAVATAITQASLFSKTQLQTLYASCGTVTVGTPAVTYNPGTATAGQQQIDLYVPQPGSGTRNFWATQMGFNNTTLPACVHDHMRDSATTFNGPAVEEHNGTAVALDADGYMPFSIAQWVSQSIHTPPNPINLDRRYGAQLQQINGVAPTTGSPASLNPAFPINREVYNVVEACKVDSTAPNPITPGAACPANSIDPNLVAMLDGFGSSLCQDFGAILNYGFALLFNNPNETDQCGVVDAAHRSQPAPV